MAEDTPGQDVVPEKTHDVKVQEALESMLSKKNLAQDQFLASKMNPQMFIPIAVLLSHTKLEALGATREQVVAAATKSKRLSPDSDGNSVRPVLKSKRNVIILRDVPDGTTEEEILTLLAGGPHAGQIVHAKAEVNNTWFVKYKVEDGTQDVVLWLRSQVFKGQPVNAAIKSDYAVRSFVPMTEQNMGFVPPGAPGGPPGSEFVQMSQPMRPAMNIPEFTPGMMNHAGFQNMQGMEYPMLLQGGHAPPMQMGMQSPGYWKPWGMRAKPAPLVFSPDSVGVPQPDGPVADQLPVQPVWQKGGKWSAKNDPAQQSGFKGKKGGKGDGGKSAGKSWGKTAMA